MVRTVVGRWQLALLLALIARPLTAQNALTAGRVVMSICRPRHPASFAIRLPAAVAAHIALNQLSEDVAITVYPPSGPARRVDQFDFSMEEFTIASAVAGTYRLEVSLVKGNVRTARFSIQVASISELTPVDERRIAAEDMSSEGKELARNRSEWRQALELTRLSLDAWQELGLESNVARTHLKAGDLLHSRSYEEQARAEYRIAENLCRRLSDLRCLAESANNVGLASLSMSDVDDSETEFNIALEAWNRISMPMMEASTRLNIGLLLWTTNEFPRALGQYDLARRMFQGRKPVSLARTLNNIGLVYLSMSDFRKASLYFRKALLVSAGQADADPVRARIRINLGRAHLLDDHLELALKDERVAVTEMKLLGDDGGLAEALNNFAQVEIRRGNLSAAEPILKQALALYREVKNLRGAASALHHLGVLASRGGQWDQARELLEEALLIRKDRRLLDDADDTLYELAVVEKGAIQLGDCFRRINEAIAIAESLRSRVLGEQLRASYFSGKRKYSDFYISALLSDSSTAGYGGRVERAFEISERFQARWLLDLLGEDRLSAQNALPGDLRRLRSVRRQLNAMSYRMATASETDAMAFVTEWQNNVQRLLADEAEMESSIRSQNAKYLEAVAPPIASLPEIQHGLGAGDVLLKYFLGEKRSFVWIIQRNRVRVTELPTTNIIKAQAESFVSLLGAARQRSTDAGKQAAWHSIQERLRAALGLSFNEAPRRIIVIPEGVLNLVPFAALPLRITGQHAHPNLLGLACEIVQAPSASVYQILEQRRRQIEAMPLSTAVFADPVFDSLDSRVKKTSDSRGKTDPALAGIPLARLSYSQAVVDTVVALFPKERRFIARGFEVNRSNFFDEKRKVYSLLLLLTHALTFDRYPAQTSNLVLSLVDKQGQPADGLLSLQDLYDLKLRSSLVLILACRTLGHSGGGFVGLSAGFLVGGASGVLASPLRVEAEPTSYFVAEYLKALAALPNTSSSAALLQARRNFAEGRWADPFYWSSFTLTGGL